MNTCRTLDLKYLCFQHLQKIGGGGVIMVNQHPATGAGSACPGPLGERRSRAERPLSSPESTTQGVTLFHLFCLAGHRPPVYPKLLSQRAPSFTLFAKSENYLASIQSFAHSFLSRRTSMREPKTPGCTLFTGHWSLVYPERTRRGASVRRILAQPNPRRLP